MRRTQDLNVLGTSPLVTPREIIEEFPITEKAADTVWEAREDVRRLIDGEDDRMLLVVGPCSIHDEEAAMEYAEKLFALREDVKDRFVIIMRVYFEKPRTTIGWKGLINDPMMDGTFDIATGMRRARALLLKINEIGLPAGTEVLDPITPRYLAALIAWASLGARTSESQTHREMASGLSMPIGFKNATDGNVQIAVDAMNAARHSHNFVGIDYEGRTCVVATRGNRLGHMILRGGRSGPNYTPDHLASTVAALKKADLPPRIMVDCSHANSSKHFRRQAVVWRDVIDQRMEGNPHIMGMMLESNLLEGNQKLVGNPADLQYGVSVTDPCLGWEKTEELIREAHAILSSDMPRR